MRGPSRLASPTVRPRVIDLPGARMRRSVPLDLRMLSMLLRRYSRTTATASWCARSPVLPGQIEANQPRCARFSPEMTVQRARIALSQTPPRRPVPNPPLLAYLQDHSSTTSWRELGLPHRRLGCGGGGRAPAPRATNYFDLPTLLAPAEVSAPQTLAQSPRCVPKKLRARVPRTVPGPPCEARRRAPLCGSVRARPRAARLSLCPTSPAAPRTPLAPARRARARYLPPPFTPPGSLGARWAAP